ncbi:hypothetical protein ACWJJH_16630 [Endozoicomonadaceae bacterium StTr2]
MKRTYKIKEIFYLAILASLFSAFTIAGDIIFIELPESPVEFSTLEKLADDTQQEGLMGAITNLQVTDTPAEDKINHTDFQSFLPADQDWLHCTLAIEAKKIREIELKKLPSDFLDLFTSFKSNSDTHAASWTTASSLSRSRFLSSGDDLKEDFMQCMLLGNDGYRKKTDAIRVIVTRFAKELMKTHLYSSSIERVGLLLKKHLPEEKIPEHTIEIFIGGPIGGLSHAQLHTDGADKSRLLAQAFLATEAPTVVFPLVTSDEDMSCDSCFAQCSMKCPYHILLAHNHGFCAPPLRLLVTSGAVAHAGPHTTREEYYPDRMLLGGRIYLSKPLISALEAAGKKEQFIAEYWEEYM